MKKAIVMLVCLWMITGCSDAKQDLPQRILQQLQTLPEQTLAIGPNQVKPLYSYYLPVGIGRRDSTELSEVFVKDGYRMVLNFDPSAVIIRSYYQEQVVDTQTSPSQKQDVMASFVPPKMEQQQGKWIYTGNYLTSNREIFPYTLQLIENEDSYLLYFDATLLKLYTYVPAGEVPSMLRSMVSIASSLEYEKEAVLKQYSMKSAKETSKKNLDYLEQRLPSQGSLKDLLEGNTNLQTEGDEP